MPTFTGLEALALLQAEQLDTPFILVSGTVGEEIAVSAIKAGASDYLLKDKLQRLAPSVQRALQETELRREAKAKDEKLKQAQKMEMVGQLAAGVAHDLNNKLGAILLIADSVKFGLEAGSPLNPALAAILEATTFSAKLVNQLLLIARKLSLQPCEFDLNRAIGASVEQLRPLLAPHHSLTPKLEPEPLTTYMDPAHLEQLLFNLVINAKEAMHSGGQVLIETVRTPTRARVIVRDQGCGIPKESLSRVFDPFFTTKPIDRGAGLGLAIVQAIVKSARGSITVDSVPDQGTSFTIDLPLTKDSA